MSEKLQRLFKADMTEAQRACFDLLCTVFHGEHHLPSRIYAYGGGIKCTAGHHRLSTFDFDYLTRLVVLAHDACVRVEIVGGGPGAVGLVLHKRQSRIGSMFDRHPTIEEAIRNVRPRRTEQTAPEASLSDCKKARDYYRAGLERREPAWVPSLVLLPRPLQGDFPLAHTTVAEKGVHPCESNQWGAITVLATNGQRLGVKPCEFEPLEWRANEQAPHTKGEET